jgi:hypothetical protein
MVESHDCGLNASLSPVWLATPVFASLGYIGPAEPASGVDLTFATDLAENPQSECQIQTPLEILYLLVVL